MRHHPGYFAKIRVDSLFGRHNLSAESPGRILAQKTFEQWQSVGPAVFFVDRPFRVRHHAEDIARFIDDAGNITG